MKAVPKYSIIEESLQHGGSYRHPYTELEAVVRLRGPGGEEIATPMFWFGNSEWRFRFSPASVGEWQWSVESSDPELGDAGGQFLVVESERKGGLATMPGNPRHFQRQNGEAFWFFGDTEWALFTDSEEERHDRAAVETYIDERARQGFNVVHAMLISESGWGNIGGQPFEDLASERINPAYWREVDVRLAYLNSKGITCGLALAWAQKRLNPNHWREFPSQEARLRYARYIAARYAAFDVYFIVAGEWNSDLRQNPELDESQVRREYGEIARTVRAWDPHERLIGIHSMATGTTREFADEFWCDFGDYQQNYRRLHSECLASRATGKPVVNSEYAYYLRDQNGDGICDKPNSFDIDTIRHATWDIVMAGAYVVTGFGSTYFGGFRDPGPFDVHARRNDDWERQAQIVSAVFRRFCWWRLEPCDHLLTASAPRSGDRTRGRFAEPPETVYWALREADSVYLVYVRGTATALTLSVARARYSIDRIDPRYGSEVDDGAVETEGSLRLLPPDRRDWLFRVERL